MEGNRHETRGPHREIGKNRRNQRTGRTVVEQGKPVSERGRWFGSGGNVGERGEPVVKRGTANVRTLKNLLPLIFALLFLYVDILVFTSSYG